MSIQSQINRLSANVSDAFVAIESKGVTVPTGSNSDNLANLISQITGGSGPENGYIIILYQDENDIWVPYASFSELSNIRQYEIPITYMIEEIGNYILLDEGYGSNNGFCYSVGDINSSVMTRYEYTSSGVSIVGSIALSDTFIVTVSYNDQTEMWEPDCTYQQLTSAQSSGMKIAFRIDPNDGDYNVAVGADGTNNYWEYLIYSAYEEHVYTYMFDSTGVTPDGDWVATGLYLQTVNKTYTPTESTQTETVTYDSPNYNGLQSVNVTVNPISSSYVGSGITRRDSTDLSASGATVTVPSGYYAAQASKAVDSMTLPTSATPSATSGYTSKATISRSTSDQYINIPTGYNASGAYYKVNAVPNGTVTAPSTISGTSATVSTGTNTLILSKTVSVTPSVTTAGYVSSGTAGNASVSLTASVTTKAAATYNTSTSDQTISASQYLTGAQTIKAVTYSGLSADKILSGTTVKIGDANDDDRIASVTGSVVIQHYYTGSSAPSSSLGADGDIYLQTS